MDFSRTDVQVDAVQGHDTPKADDDVVQREQGLLIGGDRHAASFLEGPAPRCAGVTRLTEDA